MPIEKTLCEAPGRAMRRHLTYLTVGLQNGPTGAAPPRNDSTLQLQSAADVGKKAWMPGTTSAAGDAAVGGPVSCRACFTCSAMRVHV